MLRNCNKAEEKNYTICIATQTDFSNANELVIATLIFQNDVFPYKTPSNISFNASFAVRTGVANEVPDIGSKLAV